MKAGRAKARHVIPCTVDDASNPFTVRVTFFVRKPGSQGAFRRVARVVLNVG